MKKKTFNFERKLDLHGKTENEAFYVFDSFIKSCIESGNKRILVITGKGKGILKNSVSRWLKSLNYKPFIREVKDAELNMGGEGAFHITLSYPKN